MEKSPVFGIATSILKTPEEFLVMLIGLEDRYYDKPDIKIQKLTEFKDGYVNFVKILGRFSDDRFAGSMMAIVEYYIEIINERIQKN